MIVTNKKLMPKKILVDLKPAFDGYAGIPQEVRLLFNGLQRLDGVDVEGLIQHGGRELSKGISLKKEKKLDHKVINKLSKVVISTSSKKTSFIHSAIRGVIDRYSLWLRATLRLPIQLTSFDASYFGDFVWQTLFSKTLAASQKELVINARFRVLSPSRSQFYYSGLDGRKFASSPPFLGINTKGVDVLLAQTPYPAKVSKNTKLVVRYHDAVPIFMPHTISDSKKHQASHFYALQENVKAGAWFACISESTREDLLKIFPSAKDRSVVIHNIVSDQYFQDDTKKESVFDIVVNRAGQLSQSDSKHKKKKIAISRNFLSNKLSQQLDLEVDYLLIVSTVEPRKNHLRLLDAWESLKINGSRLKLMVVGSLGWDYQETISAMQPWIERGDIYYLSNVPSNELRILYNHAAATICPSVYEGFDYSGVEAMKCGCPVVASDILVHREIYKNGAYYFDPYSTDDITSAINTVLSDKKTRKNLVEEGFNVSEAYTKEKILPKWKDFLESLSVKA